MFSIKLVYFAIKLVYFAQLKNQSRFYWC